MRNAENENIEIKLLKEAIFLKYGYDFRNYAEASIKRRILNFLAEANLDSVSELQHRLLYDQTLFKKLLVNLSVNVTEMFRDPTFYHAVREKLVPELRQLPFFKIWHAGCSTGMEVYSMAILLHEEGLIDRARIYATDFDELVLKKAKDGIFPLELAREYTVNYQRAGGNQSFSDYYTARYNHAIINSSLRRNIVFADHNLAVDGVFGEMNVIFCRNVLIYFNKELQNRVFRLFLESLTERGFLCLGSKESIRYSAYSDAFADVAPKEKIYRKTGHPDPEAHQETF
ncbi:Protein-glutamate O-methyltransferase CheR [Sulfidibacter corallicola]|uniref:Protein-glutamate O-methyltransferase CheR n=1 Tax=Sulfidibacter corallicola TaxID=2818388 RepID=A0A8A4TJ13_SULCO|nr:protein-glutamate O-methyltransferase CheR [Sulfidibacter corallicola]QTD49477.1 protein-glutamate O-methyltransferase CheR [Sulfidibacter corallicola]